MTDGEGLSTQELFDQGEEQWRRLRALVNSRRQRERALELVTDLFLTVENLSRRVGAMTYIERPVMVDDEDDDRSLEDRVSMAELMNVAADDDDDLAGIDSDDIESLRRRVSELSQRRLDHFRVFLAYFTSGCRQEHEVTKKLLACIRRVAPELLEKFGLSMADVARKLGETRAATSAREKRLERTLRAAGARGVVTAGARGQATSAACARAARGNSNRAGGASHNNNNATTRKAS